MAKRKFLSTVMTIAACVCLSAQPVDAQQVQVKPWFLVIVDTSGSMDQYTDPNDDGQPPNSCNFEARRLNDAKCALQNLINATGDAAFGLMQFDQNLPDPSQSYCCTGGRPNEDSQGYDVCNSAYGTCNATADSGMMRVGISEENQSEIIGWIDEGSNGSCDSELFPAGSTPLEGSLLLARDYFQGNAPSPFDTSPTETDEYAGCRPVSVILLTDGDETCGGTPSDGATVLRSTEVPVPTTVDPSGTLTIDIRTYVVGFGYAPCDSGIEAIATAGGTDAPGSCKGFYAQNEEELSVAFSQIVADSQLLEVCNGVDDDCDNEIDEGYNVGDDCTLGTGECAATGNIVCVSEYQSACNATEGTPIAENTVARCLNGLDDDCDDLVDCLDPDCLNSVPDTCYCAVEPEICDGQDNDCDGITDNIEQVPCDGLDSDFCQEGLTECVGSVLSCTDTTGDDVETCDNVDNDCDGVVDRFTRPCPTGTDEGECVPGWQMCIDGLWPVDDTDCYGAVGPSTEICDGLDNDCDTQTDNIAQVSCDGDDDDFCKDGLTLCINNELGCDDDATSQSETCDGTDEDCDGVVDDGNPGGGGQCDPAGALDAALLACDVAGQPCGECRFGVEACLGGSISCVDLVPPTVEICDLLDNDCDGITDNIASVACDGDDADFCTDGTTVCVGTEMVCNDDANGFSESCNGVDDDCDGVIDEGNPGGGADCDPNGLLDSAIAACDFGGQPCGECQYGVWTCLDGDLSCVDLIEPTTEICDSYDNDCDGVTDNIAQVACDGSDSDLCQDGYTICVGDEVACNDDSASFVETCDGTDEDCDGVADNGNPGGGGSCDPDGILTDLLDTCEVSGQPCGACQFGTEVCLDAELTCVDWIGPSSEICDGIDNDCDGVTDNIVEVACDGSDEDVCLDGVTVCAGNEMVCSDDSASRVETCDGTDEDCDGVVDNGNPGGGANCDPNGILDGVLAICDVSGEPCGACQFGVEACIDGSIQCVDVIGPRAEVCDLLDNDCDGTTDEIETIACDGDDADYCEEGFVQCQSGVLSCSDTTSDTVEICDGIDNDCDGPIDEGNPGGGAQCDLVCDDQEPPHCENVLTEVLATCDVGGQPCGQCQFGVMACIDGALECAEVIGPTKEICDGEDNDCDGQTDEEAEGTGALCDALSDSDFCEEGVVDCVGGELVCVEEAEDDVEICDAVDNDCDGEIDEGNPGGGAACDEICDDQEPPQCESVLTEVLALCQEDSEPCGHCKLGAQVCIDGAIQCIGVVGPEEEICDGLDNDCDGDTDEADDIAVNDTRLNKPCGHDQGECESGTTRCLDGAVTCDGGIGPTDEICDGLDNDCDGGTDEGLSVGAPCGTDTGECQPGRQMCDTETGEVICFGEVGPTDEICDGLDNDCDGDVDEGLQLGEPCGSDEGQCERGQRQCVDGDILCVGEIPAGREVCDCLDNDCDGLTDEEEEGVSLCAEPAACVDCQCALPCGESAEFSNTCPEGKTAVTYENDACYCVEEVCQNEECEGLTIEVDGEVVCTPNSEEVGTCVCKNNQCTYRCHSTVCVAGTVCDPRDGRCKQQSCVVFGCEATEICDAVTGKCEPDLCAAAGCRADQACREGLCFDSCADISCDHGERCVQGECQIDQCALMSCGGSKTCIPESGECVDDQCLNTACPQGLLCNPANGECQPDPCLKTRCPDGQSCQDGECIYRCPGDSIVCGGRCIDPNTDRDHCGASGDCKGSRIGTQCAEDEVCANGQCASDCPDDYIKCSMICVDPATNRAYCGARDNCLGDNAGTACGEDEVCVDGACRMNCPGRLLKCDNSCIDPYADRGYCGASNDCEGSNKGRVCAEDEVCEAGLCIRVVASDAGVEPTKRHRIFATGGGGFVCNVTALGGDRGFATDGWALFAALFGLFLWRRRKTPVVHRLSSDSIARRWVVFGLLSIVWMISGCSVDPFCLDCHQAQLEGDAAGFGLGKDDYPDAHYDFDRDAEPDAGRGSSDKDATPEECLDYELCNQKDDDCDSLTDEDFDLNTDPENCGQCGVSCVREHAFSECRDGVCRMGGCDIDFLDLDSDESNGCEYHCQKSADDDSICDRSDNDCDGDVDEDIDLNTDVMNCGSCGVICRFAHAEEGASCEEGECVLDDEKCDSGFYNIDGIEANGCEYECALSDPPEEICNLVDDDCDGEIDEQEDIRDNDDRLQQPCGTDQGECTPGTTQCENGSIVCADSVGETTEVCDGVDNNCDGETDESDPLLGLDCGDYENVGVCSRGIWQCNEETHELECLGGHGPSEEICDGFDNDCDSQIDEDGPGDGERCGEALLAAVLAFCSDGDMPCGACRFGSYRCVGGQRQCEDVIGPVLEVCDAVDNDCDGLTDEDAAGQPLSRICGSDLGVCETGTEHCELGEWVECSATFGGTESCNGRDDDCDNKVDEDESGAPLTRSCNTDCGSGTETCSWGVWQGCTAQQPTAESCNGLDDDCDGSTDEEIPGTGSSYPCDGTDSDSCKEGTMQCNGTDIVCTDTTGDAVESCNGVDDDCDGEVDEASAGVPLARACSTICGSGTETCTWGVWQDCSAQKPTAESCNGLDDDCDGSTDEEIPGTGSSYPCDGADSDSCKEGTMECNGTDIVCSDTTGDATESCNGLDDDCDGEVDEASAGVPLTRTCSTDCGSGTETCSWGVWQNCDAQPVETEVCNGLDDDCDGSTDEDIAGTGAAFRCDGPDSDLCKEGTMECNGTEIVCTDTTGDATESCNGLDDDCDGEFDEASAGVPLTRTCSTACGSGTETCSWGVWQDCSAPSPAVEQCNGLDDDCDGSTDEAIAGTGSAYPCDGSDSDLCKEGTMECNGTAIVCTDTTGDATESCNGLDDDCDGEFDEASPGVPLTRTCSTDCGSGTESCSWGVWQDCSAPMPTAETCNALDDDCDGETDEDFDLTSDSNNCGECGNVCTLTGDPHGSPRCSSSTCVIGSCDYGYWDADEVYDNGCEYGPCDYVGDEVCNGEDDDCDSEIDEEISIPASFCSPYGVCGDGSISLVDVECTGAGGWICDYASVTNYQSSESWCDGLDNDCDNLVDEPFPLLGEDCPSEGEGECRTWGTWQCVNGDPTADPICADGSNNPVQEGTGSAELCNALDDDCDGTTDEPCAPGVSDTGCVVDAWVQLPSGSYIYAYEASRPDATDLNGGINTDRACSIVGRLPWTNVTYWQAKNACEAAGGRLCRADEWEEACTEPYACDWSYDHPTIDCAIYSSNTCNGNDFDPYPGYDSYPDIAGDQDEVLPTGSMQSCFRDYSGSQVYDLSGNVKEWVLSRGPEANPLRGGATNNTAIGISCGFDYTLADDDFLFSNAGFRCCYSTECSAIRVTEYVFGPARFTDTTYNLSLNYDLSSNYFVIIQGSDGQGNNSTSEGPDANYARLTADPWGTGDLAVSGADNRIQVSRNSTGVDSWVGVVTVVESLSEHDTDGFRLLDVQAVDHAETVATSQTGQDFSDVAWTDINQVMLMGGFNAAGCSAEASQTDQHNSCWADIYPGASNEINWARDDNNDNGNLKNATSTIMVIEWGSAWTVQRAAVSGNNGGGGANNAGEYDTASIASVARDHTWVWGTGHTSESTTGRGAEGVVITLGNGVNQNANETRVAVGAEYGVSRSFTVYALTHPDIWVDYRFKTDGDSNSLVYDVTVDDANGCTNRFALGYNTSDRSETTYPRPLWSAVYRDDSTVRLERRRYGRAFAAWVQGIQLCICN